MGRALEAVDVIGKRIDLLLQRSKRTELRLYGHKDGVDVHGVRLGLTLSRRQVDGAAAISLDVLHSVAERGREGGLREVCGERGPSVRGGGPRERRTSAQNITVLTGVQYSGPVVDKRATTLSSEYDEKGDITSWISSMCSYFEVMRTSPEDRSMIMGTNTEPAVRNFIELQAVTAGYERIDLNEWLKVTPVRTLEDLITRYQDKHAALKARLKLEALKGQTWRTSMQALEQHLTGLFTTRDLGMTGVSCMDVVMGVAPKEYLSLLGLKDHTTWRELLMDLVNLEAKDLARRKKAPAGGGKSQRKQYGSSNQLALHENREAEDQSYADDLSLDDDLEPNSDMGCSTSAIESDVNEDEKLNAFKKTASSKGPNRGSGRGTIAHLPKNAKIPEKPEDPSTKPWKALRLLSSAGKQAKGVEESPTLSTTREAEPSVAGHSNEPEADQQPTLEARNDVESKAAAVQVLYSEPWEESKEVDFHTHLEHWLQLKQQRRVQGSVELTFLKLLINRRYIRVLIDSGSTTNFFSPNGIRKAGLGMKQVELQNPCQTQVGNQEVVTSTHAVKGVRVTFDKDRTVTHELNFYVMDKCPFDAVIGLGWLKAHCLRITWADNQFVGELEELRRQIDDMIDRGWIRPSELVIEEFHQQYILQFGHPKTIVSDRDTRFISKDWKDFTFQIYDIKLNKTSGRHPEANGLAEEINQTVIQLLRALIVPDQNTWDKELHKVKGLYNNSIHSATGVTPNQLQYGWQLRNPLSYLFPERSPGLTPDMPGYNAKYARLLKVAIAAMNKRKHAMIKHANKSRKEGTFEVRSYVWVKMSEFFDEEGVSRKLLPLYYGPWQVLNLFPHIDDETFPFRDPMIPRPIDGGHEIDKIVSHEGRGRNRQYKVHFLYHPLTEFFWIDRKELLKNAPRVVNAYERQIADGQTAKFSARLTPHGLTKSLFLIYAYSLEGTSLLRGG
ncbi:hypothetical protein CBR_g46264 [Chara braunii]|uniref:Integrase catalytic domain-containing protein n=1 Tax=Chara braunii TaxID=69332 RepID=A0A388K3U0_CHABU|nr:hypothetical protein CBR_g46264 [Chara braunii]|eukprot:GBG64720.1 hypothetical protein CBR_g46264 [Chara braunii]